MMDTNTTSAGRRLVAIIGFIGFGLTACRAVGDDAGGSAESDASTGLDESTADVIFAADEAFNTVTQELGAAGWTDAFAPDGRLIVAGREVVGKAAIREAMEPYLSAFRLEWAPSRAAAREGGDLGYTVGRYRSTSRANPDSVVATGMYVTIWERQAGGDWKVALDVGSPDPQPERN